MGTSADEVYNFIKEQGPVLPTAVAERFSMNTLFASAFLSELSSKGRVMVSSIKVGGSPLYYLPEQKGRLAEYKDNLHEKEQRTFEMLSSKRVVEDIKLELLDRVALRKMKDYAVPLNVTIGFQTRLYWKFFTVTGDEASMIISDMLQKEAMESQPTPRDEKEHEPQSESTTSDAGSATATVPAYEAPSTAATESVERETPSDVQREEKIVHEDIQQPPAIPSPPKEEVRAPVQESIVEKPALKQAPKPKEVVRQKHHAIEPYRIEIKDMDYYNLLEADSLGKIISSYFKNKDIVLIFSEIQKKGSDIYGIMSVPSAIGDLEYFYYAKKKKSITEKDIKEAYAESLILGYPLLYIAYGKLSKNAITFSDSKLKGCKIIELNA